MKLSQAILEGCKTTQPGRTRLVYNKEGQDCACALGAAIVASVGWSEALKVNKDEPYTWLEKKFSIDKNKKLEIPGLSPWKGTLIQNIYRANDHFDVPREEIAKILEAHGF